MSQYYETIRIRSSLTNHTCTVCGFSFYVRASFYNCPKCNAETFKEVIPDQCVSIARAIQYEFCKEAPKYGLNDDILKSIAPKFPGYTWEQLKTILEELC